MKLSARCDVNAGRSETFAALTDFSYFEHQALRRGVKLKILNETSPIADGFCWEATVKIRGKPRKITSTLTGFFPEDGYEVRSDAGSITCFGTLDLTALASNRTRMTVGLDLRPETMKGRIFVQSLKFAKSNLTERLKRRLQTLAEDIETRTRR